MSTAPIGYGRVYARANRVVLDPDAGDDGELNALLDGLPVDGLTATFYAAPSHIVSAAEQTIVLPEAIECPFDAEGYLTYSGERGVTLMASDTGNPSGWTWRVILRAPRIRTLRFAFELPAGAELNLADLTPIASSPGHAVVVGPPGPPGPPGLSGQIDPAQVAIERDYQSQMLATAIASHSIDPQPHTAYDDLPDLSLIYAAATL